MPRGGGGGGGGGRGGGGGGRGGSRGGAGGSRSSRGGSRGGRGGSSRGSLRRKRRVTTPPLTPAQKAALARKAEARRLRQAPKYRGRFSRYFNVAGQRLQSNRQRRLEMRQRGAGSGRYIHGAQI